MSKKLSKNAIVSKKGYFTYNLKLTHKRKKYKL